MVEATLDKEINRLKDQHIRITPQRKTILNYLITHHNHPTVETLFSDLSAEQSNLSMATIYNTLNLLVSVGIVIELSNETAGIRYDYFGRPHFHAICDNCGKITDVFYDNFPKIQSELKQVANEQTGYQISTAHVEVHGLCTDCQKLQRRN